MERQTRVRKNLSEKTLPLTILFLISLAIAAYGGAYVWQEALIVGAIFVVTGVTAVVTPAHELRNLPLRLLLPMVLLAIYSLMQGMVPLLFAGPENIGLVPYGLDPVSSLWNGTKMFGMVCLLGLCVIALKHHRKFFINGLIAIGATFAIIGIGRFLIQEVVPSVNQYFFAYELTPDVGFGTFLNQNHFATLMLLTMGLSIGPLVSGKKLQTKTLAYLGTGLLAWIAIILTASRAGIVASFFVVVALIIFHGARAVSRHLRGDLPHSKLSVDLARSFAGSILILVALVGGVMLIGQGRVLHRFAQLPAQIDGNAGLAFRRADVWEATEKMIREHYVYGVGFGSFRYAVSQFIDISGDNVPLQAHNDYLELVASGGLIAAALGIWFVWLLIVEISKAGRTNGGGKLSGASVGAICGIVGVAVQSLADFGLQYIGNTVFFIALIAVAVGSSRMEGETYRRSKRSPRKKPYILATVCLAAALCGVCAVFGVSRYLLSVGAETPMVRIPFDAEYHAATAGRLRHDGDDLSAVKSLRAAANLRHHDYALWLRLAELEATAGDWNSADASFRNSIDLAPLYGEPHFSYGAFLLQTSRNIDGINELVLAARRDWRFTDDVLELIWGRTTYITEYLGYLTTGEHHETNARVFHFLVEKKEYELLVDLFCRVEFSDVERDMIIRRILERRAFRAAWRIYHRQCQQTPEPPPLIDGDFEMSEVRKGTGFGWLLGESLERSNFGFDRAQAFHGQQSLKFMFNGEVRSALLRQTVAARPHTRYSITFSYKSGAIVSGGRIVVRILAKGSAEAVQLAEAELSNSAVDWKLETLTFETREGAEAIEVLLTSRSCADPKCPIFGELWVDDFRILELGAGSDRPGR